MHSPSDYQRLEAMLRLQESANERVHRHWRQQHYAWLRALWVECAELLSHVGYKWWNQTEIDWPQVKLEVVDIWHFGMSQLLQEIDPQEGFVPLARKLLGSLDEHCPDPQPELMAAAEELARVALAEGQFSVAGFWELLSAVDMGLDELFRCYAGKNVLNRFRQDQGYATGDYRKCWRDGREDNLHLEELARLLDSGHQDYSRQLYRALEERYLAQA